MKIQPLNGILSGIGSGSEWKNQRLLQQLMSQWNDIVGPTVAKHSRPLEVRNGALQVATSTAVWAQNLSFERRRILQKLNARPEFKPLGLKEIRFSTVQWHSHGGHRTGRSASANSNPSNSRNTSSPESQGASAIDPRLGSYQQLLQWQQHPCRMPPSEELTDPGNSERSPGLNPPMPDPAGNPARGPMQAFERWSQRRRQQVRQVPLCPQCKAPAPPGELLRWGVCAFCMAPQWQAVKEANQSDGAEDDSWKSTKSGGQGSATEASDAASASRAERGESAERLTGEAQRNAEAGRGLRHTAFAQSFPRSASGPGAASGAKPIPGRFRDPALTGPLAPLSAEPPKLDAVSQDPLRTVTDQRLAPDVQGSRDQDVGARGGEAQESNAPGSEMQRPTPRQPMGRQMAWAQSFQAQHVQNAQAVGQRAPAGQQVDGDRLPAQTHATQPSPKSNAMSPSEKDSKFASGRSKPVLKPQGKTRVNQPGSTDKASWS